MSAHTREIAHEFLTALLGTAVIIAMLTMLISCTSFSDNAAQAPLSSSQPVSFENEIKPVFEGRCVTCHNGHVAAGDLNLLTRELAFRRSSNGPFIVPGYPERSKLFRMVRLADDEPGAMPPTGHALTEQELATLKRWIKQGAEWPEGEAGYLQPTKGMNWRSR